MEKKKKVRLRFSLRRLVSGLFPGRFLSTQKGPRGYEIEELTKFRPGMDPRALDRKASIKRGELIVALKEVEKAAKFIFLVDKSKSGKFGTSGLTKEDLQTSLLDLLAPLAAAHENQVGFIVFTDRIEKYWPPRSGFQRTLERVRQMSSYATEGSLTDLNSALVYLNRLNLSTGAVVILSDFIAPLDFKYSLEIASAKHDVVPIVLKDKREQELPKIKGSVPLRDMESGKLKYVDLSQGFLKEISVFEVFKEFNLDWLVMTTDETEEERIRKLANFFRKRRKKRGQRR